MSLPSSSSSINNKPRPLINKSRHAIMSKNRASTFPLLSHHTTAIAAATADTEQQEQDDFLPSIQESLQEWLARSIPTDNMESFDGEVCKCCKQNDCENLEVLRKLESDSRLAAEIGQSLLAKHEQFVSRSNEIKYELEEKVERLEFKVHELESNICESDNLRQDLIQEKDKLIWECQKTQKILDETVIDLETSNDRCIHLGSELKSKITEVEKLRIFKFMARQADIREDNLRAQLEDLKQELAVSRKTELTLESKYKKLKTKYESTCFSYEKLKSDYQEFGLARDHQLDLVWLKESNEKLRKDVLRFTSALLTYGVSGSNAYSSNETTNSLIQLVKELASANNKLKSDLLDCSDLLLECRNDLYLKLKEEEEENDMIMQHDESNRIYAAATTKEGEEDDKVPAATDMSADLLWLQQEQQQQQQQQQEETDDETKIDVTQQQQQNNDNINDNINSDTIINNKQQILDSTATIVHHHYHYYMKNKILAAEREKKEKGKRRKSISATDSETQTPSFRASAAPTKKIDTSSPFRQLYNQVSNILTRLEQTDIRVLNRRLKRAFDMIELSSMSNSIIENIVMEDIDGLRTNFLWIEQHHTLLKDEPWIDDISMLEFFPLLGLVQNMLKEIGQLRTTMNDLQVEYVKKVEESDKRLSQDMKRKQLIEQEEAELQKRKRNVGSGTAGTSSSPISNWFSKVFNSSNSDKREPQPQQQPQEQPISGYTFNNSSDISIKSSSAAAVHPLSMPSNTTATSENSSMIAIIRRKKSDILVDRHGPPSSFPSRSNFLPPSTSILSSSTNNKQRRSTTSSSSPKTTTSFLTPPPVTIRASQSAGTVRKSKSMQAPALDYVVRRKRSTLGLSVSSNNSDNTSGENNNSITFATTSWLGNK